MAGPLQENEKNIKAATEILPELTEKESSKPYLNRIAGVSPAAQHRATDEVALQSRDSRRLAYAYQKALKEKHPPRVHSRSEGLLVIAIGILTRAAHSSPGVIDPHDLSPRDASISFRHYFYASRRES